MTSNLVSIVIPTYNRSLLISKTLNSIVSARAPTLMPFIVLIVDNNSSAVETAVYKDIVRQFSTKLQIKYIFESKQGRSHALNRGILESQAQYCAFIDDDEEIDREWLAVISAHIEKGNFDYLVGACLPNWEASPPKWLPAHSGQYRGLLGWIEQSNSIVSFSAFDGELIGGNCVIRTSILRSLGGFNSSLGRSSDNLMGGEDGELHRRLKMINCDGIYDPNLIIYHLIPENRMTINYHIRWAFWSGASNGVRIKRASEPTEEVTHLFGIPRYQYLKGILGVMKFFKSIFLSSHLNNSNGICGLLDSSYLIGLIYGRYILRV